MPEQIGIGWLDYAGANSRITEHIRFYDSAHAVQRRWRTSKITAISFGQKEEYSQKYSSAVVALENSPGKIIGEFIIRVIFIYQLDKLRKVRSV